MGPMRWQWSSATLIATWSLYSPLRCFRSWWLGATLLRRPRAAFKEQMLVLSSWQRFAAVLLQKLREEPGWTACCCRHRIHPWPSCFWRRVLTRGQRKARWFHSADVGCWRWPWGRGPAVATARCRCGGSKKRWRHSIDVGCSRWPWGRGPAAATARCRCGGSKATMVSQHWCLLLKVAMRPWPRCCYSTVPMWRQQATMAATALMLAAQGGHEAVAQLLLQHGADVAAAQRWRPQHWCAGCWRWPWGRGPAVATARCRCGGSKQRWFHSIDDCCC